MYLVKDLGVKFEYFCSPKVWSPATKYFLTGSMVIQHVIFYFTEMEVF